MDWLSQNKDWIFSGIGISIPLFIIGILIKSSNQKKIKQKQKSGNNSTNIQVGGDLKK